MAILARWVAELQVSCKNERESSKVLAQRVTELEHQISAFAYWMNVGKTPARIKHLAEMI